MNAIVKFFINTVLLNSDGNFNKPAKFRVTRRKLLNTIGVK
ncbi:MAG: hypothetical protein ACYC96_02715 [Fimbriimonadaceae bacterium]